MIIRGSLKLKTFQELKQTTNEMIEDKILKSYKSRVTLLSKKYWSHTKDIRKKYNLREDFFSEFKFEFSGADLLNTICAALIAAEKNLYPINVATIYEKKAGNDILDNFQQLRNWLDLNLNLLDFEIHNAEYLMLKNCDFHPDIERLNPIYDKQEYAWLQKTSLIFKKDILS